MKRVREQEKTIRKWSLSYSLFQKDRMAVKKAVLSIIITGMCFAQCFAAGAGTSGGQFLKIGVGARASAMGESAAVLKGMESIFYNPAGMADVRGSEVFLSQVKWIKDVSYSNIGFGKQTASGVYGLAVNYLSVPPIESYDNTGTKLAGSYDVRDMAVLFGYGKRLNNRLDAGLDIKYISSTLEANTATAVAGDAGAIYALIPEKCDLGLAARNIGTQLKFISEADPLPMTFKLGARYVFAAEDKDYGVRGNAFLTDKCLTLLGDVNYVNDTGFYSNLGLEIKARSSENLVLALRGGYRTNSDSRVNGMSLGMGLDTKGYVIDYAYSPFGDLGQAHRISLSMRFGDKDTVKRAYKKGSKSSSIAIEPIK